MKTIFLGNKRFSTYHMLSLIGLFTLFTGCDNKPAVSPSSSGKAPQTDHSVLSKAKEGFKQLAVDGVKTADPNPQKLVYKVMSNLIAEEDLVSQKWLEASDAIKTPRILNCEVLNNPEEYDFQRKKIQAFIDSTKTYREFSASMIDRLKEQLTRLRDADLGVTDQMINQAAEGMEKDLMLQKPFFDPLLQENIEYGKTMLAVLDLLEENQKEWVFQNGEAIIYHSYVLKQYDKLLNQLDQHGLKINKLSEEMSKQEL